MVNTSDIIHVHMHAYFDRCFPRTKETHRNITSILQCIVAEVRDGYDASRALSRTGTAILDGTERL